VYRRSVSSGRPSLRKRILARESGPQGLRRPRFSFFLFTCQTARGPGGPRPPAKRRAVEASRFRPRSDAFSLSSVRSFEGAPSHREADGAPYRTIYSRRRPAMSTPHARNTKASAAPSGPQVPAADRHLDGPTCNGKRSTPHCGHIPPTYFAWREVSVRGFPVGQRHAVAVPAQPDKTRTTGPGPLTDRQDLGIVSWFGARPVRRPRLAPSSLVFGNPPAVREWRGGSWITADDAAHTG
jgi:hypothetical protein